MFLPRGKLAALVSASAEARCALREACLLRANENRRKAESDPQTEDELTVAGRGVVGTGETGEQKRKGQASGDGVHELGRRRCGEVCYIGQRGPTRDSTDAVTLQGAPQDTERGPAPA